MVRQACGRRGGEGIPPYGSHDSQLPQLVEQAPGTRIQKSGRGLGKNSSSQGLNPKKLRIVVYAEDDFSIFKLHGKQDEQAGKSLTAKEKMLP